MSAIKMLGWLGNDSRLDVKDRLLIIFASGKMDTAEIKLIEPTRIEDIIDSSFYEAISNNPNLRKWYPNDPINEVYVEFDLIAEADQFTRQSKHIDKRTPVKEDDTFTVIIPKCKQRHLIHFFDFAKRNADYFVNDTQIAEIREGVITRV